jgi:hypothetical protein
MTKQEFFWVPGEPRTNGTSNAESGLEAGGTAEFREL